MQEVTINIGNFDRLGCMEANVLNGFNGFTTTCSEVNGDGLNGILIYVPGLNETVFSKMRDNEVN